MILPRQLNLARWFSFIDVIFLGAFRTCTVTLNILLTNDDGPKSPFLPALSAALSAHQQLGEIRIVVPAEEQSWIGQAVTRFRPLFVSTCALEGRDICLVSGTPADCVGLGLHNLFSDTSSAVISGINFGTNASLPFYMNSGTVGAARQAVTFGVRSIALSALIPEQIFRAWRHDDFDALKPFKLDFARISRVAAALSVKLLEEACWEGVDMFSVNFPWEVDDHSEVVVTELERGRYKPLYKLDGPNRYTHHFQGFHRPTRTGDELRVTDFEAIDAGKISLTPVRYESVCLPEATCAALATITAKS